MPGKSRRLYLPAIIWGVLILIVSSIPDITTPSVGFTMADKAAHFIEYLIFGILTANAIRTSARNLAGVFWTTSGTVSVFGILDELHQLLIPGRSTEALDMLANVLGSVCGAILFVTLFRKRISG